MAGQYPVPGYPGLTTSRPQGTDLASGQVDVKDVSPALLTRLSSIAQSLGQTIDIFSGYRTDAYSAANGGFAGDPHTKGYAVDAYLGSGTAPVGSSSAFVKLAHALGLGSGATDFSYQGASDPSHVDLLGTSRSYTYAAQLAGGSVSPAGTTVAPGASTGVNAGPSVSSSGAPSGDTVSNAIIRIVQDAKQYKLDPAALLAVAVNGEGNFSNPGDSNSSFGPFSLHQGGALNTSPGEAIYQSSGAPSASLWAWSPAGVDYAVGQIAQAVPQGQTGTAAISSIVTQFEHPADPTSEINRAVAGYPKAQQVSSLVEQGATVTSGGTATDAVSNTVIGGVESALNIAGTSQAQGVLNQIPIVGPAVSGAGDTVNALGSIASWSKSPVRILQLVLGGALVLLGLFLLARPASVLTR